MPSQLVLDTRPVVGKTYSLYGSRADRSDGYFAVVDALVNDCQRQKPDPARLLAELGSAGRSPRQAARQALRAGTVAAYICTEGGRRLEDYFPDLAAHRQSLSWFDRCSKVLTMSREQHLLAAVEIELQNRINAAAFARCRERLALLPHCLRDLDADCGARPRGLDTVCAACSSRCYLNAVSRLLRRARVRPYIWQTAKLSRLFREQAGALGILGIACLPELLAGMRRCARAGVPVVGVPLDANRCRRWLGKMHPTTVNLARLERLVAPLTERPRPRAAVRERGNLLPS